MLIKGMRAKGNVVKGGELPVTIIALQKAPVFTNDTPPIINQPVYNSKCPNVNEMSDLKYFVGNEFSLMWTFLNNSLNGVSWPAGVSFRQVSGDNIGSKPYVLNKSIPCGETVDIVVNYRTPTQPGKYHAFFRLCHGPLNIDFGEKVYIDLLAEAKPGKGGVMKQVTNLLFKKPKVQENLYSPAENDNDTFVMLSPEPRGSEADKISLLIAGPKPQDSKEYQSIIMNPNPYPPPEVIQPISMGNTKPPMMVLAPQLLKDPFSSQPNERSEFPIMGESQAEPDKIGASCM